MSVGLGLRRYAVSGEKGLRSIHSTILHSHCGSAVFIMVMMVMTMMMMVMMVMMVVMMMTCSLFLQLTMTILPLTMTTL